MKIANGIDIIEVNRIKKAIEKHGDKFLNTVYTKNEIIYCEKYEEKKYEHYAARFAAKEATFKAFSRLDSEFENNMLNWQEIEVENDKNGRPKLILEQKKKKLVQDIDISLSHVSDNAVAVVTILY